jgi:regulator of cell morphogenesis and NO signaling
MTPFSVTVGDLARTQPAASRVFQRYHIDYCCGGDRSLGEVCKKLGVDPQVLLAEVEAEDRRHPEAVAWNDRAPLRPEIARLREMAHKVEQVHADKASCPRGLAAHLDGAAQAIEDHLRKEEEVLFPMIVSGDSSFLRMPVQMMVMEHEDHGESLRRTRFLTHDFTIPDEACTTWRALYLGLEQLERDLMDHIHLENNVVFPKALNR